MNKSSGRYFLASLVTILLSLVLTGTALAYQPPIGIPKPSFGIDEVSPVNPIAWPSAEASNAYYIDKTSPLATDSANPFGFPDKPRLTLPRGVLPAGTLIEIHGGVYAGADLYLSCAGTLANPCWIRGQDSQNMPVISRTITMRESSYTILENIDFSGASGPGLTLIGSSHHIALRNSRVRNKTYLRHTAGVIIRPNSGMMITDIVVYNTSFYSLGDWTVPQDQDFHGVNADLWGRDSTSELKNIWVLASTFYNLSGNGVQINAGNWTDSYRYLHHVYIGGNIAYDNRQSGIWSKQASDVIISQNTLHGRPLANGLQPGDGVGYQYGPNNIWIIYNHIYDSNFGIRQSDTNPINVGHKAYIIGNLIHNIHPGPGVGYSLRDPWRRGQGIALWEGGDMDRYIIDNTIFDVEGGINLIHHGPARIAGNIIFGINPGDFYIAAWQTQDVTVVGKNIFYDPGQSENFSWGNRDYSTLNAFSLASGQCQGCLVSNPLFVDAASNNFNLRQGSPAIDFRAEDSVYSIFQTLYGLDIRLDAGGGARPRGRQWDAGAFEYQFLPPLSPPGTMTLSCR